MSWDIYLFSLAVGFPLLAFSLVTSLGEIWICPLHERQRDRRQRQAIPDGQVTGLRSKGTYFQGSSWVPQDKKSPAPTARILNVYIEAWQGSVTPESVSGLHPRKRPQLWVLWGSILLHYFKDGGSWGVWGPPSPKVMSLVGGGNGDMLSQRPPPTSLYLTIIFQEFVGKGIYDSVTLKRFLGNQIFLRTCHLKWDRLHYNQCSHTLGLFIFPTWTEMRQWILPVEILFLFNLSFCVIP